METKNIRITLNKGHVFDSQRPRQIPTTDAALLNATKK